MASVETDLPYEVVGGRRIDAPYPGGFEGLILSALLVRLFVFARSNGYGRVVRRALFQLDADGSLQLRPDLAFISYQRWARNRPIPERVEAIEVVPDLAVEVVDPSQTASALFGKLGEYFRAGARHVWVILPDQRQVYDYASTTSVQILGWDDQLSGGEVVPGFAVRVSELFEDVLPTA